MDIEQASIKELRIALAIRWHTKGINNLDETIKQIKDIFNENDN